MKNTNINNKYYSTTEVSDILGVSRITIFNWIKSGKIKAQKFGRNYLVERDDLIKRLEKKLNDKDKIEISEVVNKTIKDYGETLRMLGQE